MLQILISALIKALQGQVGEALVTALTNAIKTVASTSLSGSEKKAKVLEDVANVGGAVAKQLQDSSGSILNLLIELIVVKLKKA